MDELPPPRMKVLLHSHFPAGHCYPMQAVAQSLVRRGHSVVWLTSADNEHRVRLSGAQFVPTTGVAAVDAPLMRRHETGLLGAESHSAENHEGRLLAQVRDYRSVLKEFAADVLLVDVLPYGAQALYELGEVPVYATLGVIPMYLSGADSPLAVSGNQPPRTWYGRLLNWLNHLFQQYIVRPLYLRPLLNRERKILGLNPLSLAQPLESFTYSRFLHIQASSPTLEFGQHTLPAADQFGFTGPLVADLPLPNSRQLPDWWEDRVTSHTRVIGITQGTLAMDPTSLIIPSIQALRADPRNLLVVVSPHADDLRKQFGPDDENQNDNVLFADWLPYDLLLPELSLLITNGGYGSITQALSHSVPLLCAGQTEDKKDTAARVAWAKAGIDLKTDNPSVDQVRRAAQRILDDEDEEGFVMNVAKLRDELNSLGGASTTCSLLEDLGRKVIKEPDYLKLL